MTVGQEETQREKGLPKKLSQLRPEVLGQETISVKHWGPRSQEALLQPQPSVGLTSALSFTSCVTFGNLHNLSEPHQ